MVVNALGEGANTDTAKSRGAKALLLLLNEPLNLFLKFVLSKKGPNGTMPTLSTLLANKLRVWRGKRYRKEAASDLGIPLATYRKYEEGKRTPNKLAMAELERRLLKTFQ